MNPFIQAIEDHGILKYGVFTLKSGRISPYFFNAGQFNTGLMMEHLSGQFTRLIIETGTDFDVVFGPAYKGIPLCVAVSGALNEVGVNCGFAFNRKERKDHGEGGTLIGAEVKGKKVLIVDDVITAGTAIQESITLLRAAGANVVRVLTILDRKEKPVSAELSATQFIENEYGIPVHSILTVNDLLDNIININGADSELACEIKAYTDKYGI